MMRCPTCYGGTEFAACVCQTQADLWDTTDAGALDPRFMFAPDARDEYRHPDDYAPQPWAERHED
jgi:hypothetical protein